MAMSRTVRFLCVVLIAAGSLPAVTGCSGARPEGRMETSVPANAREVDVERKLESGTVATVEELLIGEPSIVYDGGVLRIRGRSGAPLWVIDGAQTTSTMGLNPYDVERMWIVTDAVNPQYGRRGLNGVIIVRTRAG